MISRKDKRLLPLVLVKAKKEDKGTLFQINRCCHLVVKVEHQSSVKRSATDANNLDTRKASAPQKLNASSA